MIKKTSTIFLAGLLMLVISGPAMAATPTVASFTPGSASVGRYQKYEATFQISKTYPANSFLPYYFYDSADTPAADPGRNSPYGVDGISIDAYFTSPSGKVLKVPAFYFQDYQRSGNLSSETITPTNNYSWKIRFAPEELGSYKYYLTISDKEGSTRYPATDFLSFSSVSSSSKGFVRASIKDPRFLAYSDGSSFIQIASAMQWWQDAQGNNGRSYMYESAFNKWRDSGINLVRIWDQNDGFGLVVEGQYDAYIWPDGWNPVERGINVAALPKGTQMNQRANYDQDKILAAAEANGVYIEFCSRGDPYWIWDYVSGSDQSGWAQVVSDTDRRYVNYWKRNFRYRVARWGYSTSVLAWELWNEHGHVLPGTSLYNFYQLYGEYQKQTDPYNHLRTTSQGSAAYSPGLLSSSAFDIANNHGYMMAFIDSADYYDETHYVYHVGWCLGNYQKNCAAGTISGDTSVWSGPPKPWIWGELDVGTNEWNVVNPKVRNGGARVRMLHNSTWAGLFSPMGVSPLDWYYNLEDAATTALRYADRKATAAFFRGLDYDGGKFTFLMSSNFKPSGYSGETLTAPHSSDRVLAMRREDKKAIYLWIVDSANTWNNYPNSPSVATNVTVSGLLGENYKIEVWNTHTGQIVSTTNASGPTITVPAVPGLTEDAAVKIESSIPAPVPKIGIDDLRQAIANFVNIFNVSSIIAGYGR